jgi:amino acid adenylation domain-containing protein
MGKAADKIIDSYPLSPIQLGMLFESLREARMDSENRTTADRAGVYLIQCVVQLKEAIDAPTMLRALEGTAARHTILRTSLRWDGLESPMQLVYQEIKLPFQEQDLCHLSGQEQEQALARFLREDRQGGLDLNKAPLFRATLCRLSDEKFKLILTFHHTIMDGWSIVQWTREILELYKIHRTGHEPRMSLATPYREYIEWLKNQDFSQAEAYWRQRLRGFRAPTAFGVDQIRTGVSSGTQPGSLGDYRKQHYCFPDRLRAALTCLAMENNLTLNTLFQGAWAILLSRYTDEREVVFGSTRHCRRSVLDGKTDQLVGPILNTLPLRVELSGKQAAIAWLQTLRRQWVEMRPYENVPPAMPATCSDIPAGQPLFKSFCNFENQSFTAWLRSLSPGWQRCSVEVIQVAPYPLIATITGAPELTLDLTYDSRLFDDESISRLLGHVHNLLAEMAANPKRQLNQLNLLTAAEQRKVLVEWNATQKDYPRELCVPQLFEQQAERTPQGTAAIEAWPMEQAAEIQMEEDEKSAIQELSIDGVNYRSLNYEALNARANQLAHYLRKQGVGPEASVGVCMGRSLELAVALLGILKAGAVYLPLDPKLPVERRDYMLADSRAQLLLTQQQLAGQFSPGGVPTLCLNTGWRKLAGESLENSVTMPKPHNLAYILYTSGSTGKPKGVMVDHQALMNFIYWKMATYPMAFGDRMLQLTSISFDPSLWNFLEPLLQGAGVVLARPGSQRDIPYLVDVIQAQQITILQMVPSHLRLFMEEPRFLKCASVRSIFCGGENMPPTIPERISRNLAVTLTNNYGPTETCVSSTTYQLKPGTSPPRVPVGVPHGNTQVYILDRSLQPAPVGVTGELYIGGDSLARGYLNQPALTAEKFIPNPFGASGTRLYRTGDLCRYLADGNIEFLGRVDNQVKLRGNRIELGEIENALEYHPLVRQAVVLLQHAETGDHLAAYIVPNSSRSLDRQQLREYLKGRLPEYMLPGDYIILDALPLTPNGKIDLNRLPRSEITSLRDPKNYVAPRSPLEQILTRLFSMALEKDKLSVQEDFFELGGHSLLVMRLVAQINDIFQCELPLITLFKYPTVEQLADFMLQDEQERQRIELTADFILGRDTMPD